RLAARVLLRALRLRLDHGPRNGHVRPLLAGDDSSRRTATGGDAGLRLPVESRCVAYALWNDARADLFRSRLCQPEHLVGLGPTRLRPEYRRLALAWAGLVESFGMVVRRE